MVEDEDFQALRYQPLRQDDLLLIAAAQIGRRRFGRWGLDPQPVDPARGERPLAPRIDERPAHDFAQVRQRHVLLDTETPDDALDAAFRWHVADARLDGAGGILKAGERSVDQEFAAIGAFGAEQSAAERFPAGALHARQPEHLAATEIEADRLIAPRLAQVANA